MPEINADVRSSRDRRMVSSIILIKEREDPNSDRKYSIIYMSRVMVSNLSIKTLEI